MVNFPLTSLDPADRFTQACYRAATKNIFARTPARLRPEVFIYQAFNPSGRSYFR